MKWAPNTFKLCAIMPNTWQALNKHQPLLFYDDFQRWQEIVKGVSWGINYLFLCQYYHDNWLLSYLKLLNTLLLPAINSKGSSMNFTITYCERRPWEGPQSLLHPEVPLGCCPTKQSVSGHLGSCLEKGNWVSEVQGKEVIFQAYPCISGTLCWYYLFK